MSETKGFRQETFGLLLILVLQLISKSHQLSKSILYNLIHASLASNDAATISYATTVVGGTRLQKSGSTEGGTLLWIYGTGFALTEFSFEPSIETSNTVELVRGTNTYDCNMQSERSTESQLACYTPAMPAGEYQIRVYVNGNQIPLSQYTYPTTTTFIASASNTPSIGNILPSSGSPQRLITLNGDFKTQCYLRDIEGCSDSNVSVISR